MLLHVTFWGYEVMSCNQHAEKHAGMEIVQRTPEDHNVLWSVQVLKCHVV